LLAGTVTIYYQSCEQTGHLERIPVEFQTQELNDHFMPCMLLLAHYLLSFAV
jgi:hypothetical protein